MALSETERYEDILRKSRTAYYAGAKPTSSDISAQEKLLSARKAEEKKEMDLLKEKWYGKKGKADREIKDEKGLIGKALHAVGTPFYGVSGTVAHALGRGSEKDLLSNIKASIRDERTFGDLLRGYGMSNYVAMPLGFALDVAFDPVSWLTLGTSGLVGKTARGLMKGGVTGAGLGAKARTLEKAAWAAEKVPEKILGKKILSPEKYKSLTASAERAKVKYEKMAGDTIEEVAARSETREGFFDKLSRKIDETRSPGLRNFGKNIETLFGYSSAKWFQKSLKAEDVARDEVIAKASKGVFKKEADESLSIFKKTGESVREADIRETKIKMAMQKKADDSYKKNIREEIKHLEKILKTDRKAFQKFSGMADKDIDEMANLFRHYKIEFKNYDKKVAKVLLGKKSRAFLKQYARFIGIFKNAKIGGNPATWVNASIGNPTMAEMMGIDILDPKFLGSIKKGVGIAASKNAKSLKPFLDNENWIETMRKYPITFDSIFGIDATVVLGGRRALDGYAKEMMKKGSKLNKVEIDDVKKFHDEVFREYSTERVMERGFRQVARTIPGSNRTTFLSDDIMRGPYADWVNGLKIKADEGNKLAKYLHWYSTKPMEGYNKIDQSWRLGTSLHLVENGISEKRLRLIMKRVPIGMTDITKVGNKFKLSPLKAMEIAQETYMNYLAMPAFVQMMRTLPVLGQSFISFAYGMTALSAKTARHNPAFYNKVQFLLKEISGDKSPYEKESLEGEYYNFLNRPGMMKLPFFQDNPLYLNTANMLPHYTMNILQPSERDYESRYGGAFANMVDKLPFLKSPDGQIMFDYVILPMLLQDESPQGQFGQPLWEKDAGLLKKAGYFTRAGIETVLPPMGGLLGLGALAGLPPEKHLGKAPIYRWRQLGYATKGKTGVGIKGEEPAISRTARVIAAMHGFPTHAMNLKYRKYKKKK